MDRSNNKRLNRASTRSAGSETTAPEKRDQDIMEVRRVVASNPNTPKPVLARLSDDESAHVRRCVAENPRCPTEVLKRLADDAEPEVRLAVAENGNTPVETLSALAADDSVDVRFGVAENPHIPEDILFALVRDDNPYIRCRAIKTLQMINPDIESRLRLLLTFPDIPHGARIRQDIEHLA